MQRLLCNNKRVASSNATLLGGERGIRTLGTLLTYTRFPIVLFRPLRHLSKVSAYRIIAYRGETDKQNEAKNQKSPDRIHTRRQKKARVASFANIAFTAETALAPLARQKVYPPRSFALTICSPAPFTSRLWFCYVENKSKNKQF